MKGQIKWIGALSPPDRTLTISRRLIAWPSLGLGSHAMVVAVTLKTLRERLKSGFGHLQEIDIGSGRMVLLDISATGEENLIEQRSGDPMNDLEYRRRQLLKLQDAVIDLEDLSSGVSIADLTLTDFRIDLADYRKSADDELDAMPPGMYAVTVTADDDIPPGVIFCLRAEGDSAARRFEPGYPPMWSHWTDGIHLDHRDLAREVLVADEVKLHKYAAHLLSSQVFALNLFLPFREGSRKALSECVSRTVGTRLLVDEVRFEWVLPGALLGELVGDRPGEDEPATAVDVVLWSRIEDSRRAAVLVEVKLTEDGFMSCNGRDSRWNRRQDVCGSARLFFGNPITCYLRRPKGKQRDQRYWEIFAESHGSVRDAFPGADSDGPCPFAGNAQQPMRNLAIARALEQEGMVEEAWFVLCAHDENPDVPGHWEVWKGILPDPDMAPSLRASAVIDAGEAEGYGAWAAWMRERYRLGETQ